MPLSTANSFVNIIPKSIVPRLGRNAYSIAIFRDQLYLVVADYDLEQVQSFIQVLCYSFLTENWKEACRMPLGKSHTTEDNSDQSETLEEPYAASGLEYDGAVYEGDFSCELIVSRDESTDALALYLRLISPWGAKLLRSRDGENFEVIAASEEGGSEFFALHKFIAFEDRIYALTAGSSHSSTNPENESTLYVAYAPSLQNWQPVIFPGFEDRGPAVVSELAVLNHSLYAGTLNRQRGFQLWRTGRRSPQTREAWEQVIADGAYGYALSQQIFAMTEFRGELYIASGLSAADSDKAQSFYSAGFELSRFYADEDWDLIAGTPRFTPCGLKVPLSAMGPGFDNPNNRWVQCLIVHDSHLYLGAQSLEGFQLWHTEDGEVWEAVPLAELHHYYQVEVQASLSSSSGLVLLLEVTEPNRRSELQLWLCR